MTNTLLIHIPSEWNPPPPFFSLSPDDVAFIIETGTKCITQTQQYISTLSQKQIHQKIKEETSALEQRLLVQQQITTQIEQTLNQSHLLQMDKMREQEQTIADRYIQQMDKMREQFAKTEQVTTNNYMRQIQKMNEQISSLQQQIHSFENNNKFVIESEIKKNTDHFSAILAEKDRQINKINETHDIVLKQSLKSTSTSHKGKEGETKFEEIAHSTFCDFRGFTLIDKHTQSGAGDFHLQFEEFDILVDAKNYKKKVPVEQRDKIKQDLAKNEHISFAWLVSLNTSIDKFDRAPVMYEWINTKQCVVYINNLMEYEDPRKLLRIVWFTCKELLQLIAESTSNDDNNQQPKNNKHAILEKIRNMRKTIREINTTLNGTRNLLQLMDDECKSILESETDAIVESNYGLFDEWWSRCIQHTNNLDDKLLSTDVWFKFKQDNREMIKEMGVTTEKFRQFLKTKFPMSSIILKNKNTNSAFDMCGVRWGL